VKVPISLNVGELAQRITVEGSVSVAAETAPSENTLEARSAKSEISPEYIRNFASPIADYTELLSNAPGTFSVNPNGIGLGDSKTKFIRLDDSRLRAKVVEERSGWNYTSRFRKRSIRRSQARTVIAIIVSVGF
jgi:hypothetical protein